MKLEITIGNQQLMFLAVFIAAIAIVGITGAYNPSGTGGTPSVMGHSVDELDWSKPISNLEVAGQVKITGGSPSAGKVLTSDAQGVASWGTITGTLTSGASGQTLRHDGANWIANSNLFNNGGNLGIGTATPAEKLEVSGNIKLSGATATYKLTNLALPTGLKDAANKEYVDALVSAASGWTCISLKCAWFGQYSVGASSAGPFGTTGGKGFCTPDSCATGWTSAGTGCAITATTDTGSITKGYCERWCCS